MAGPLDGVRVLDLTRALAGPMCTMLLGDMGAEVIKVEPPDGDMARSWGPFVKGVSVYYLSVNRNKRSLVLDMRKPAGVEVLKRLAAQADVVVDNFRPGIAANLGLDYRSLAEVNPRAICLSISGYGSTGPKAGWPGFDQIAQGLSGLMSITGESGPLRVGLPIGDVMAGVFGCLGVVAALHRRQTTGRGEQVETSLLASLVAILNVQGQRYLSAGEVPGPAGNDHPVIYPYGVFMAEDGPLNVAAAAPEMWPKLCDVLERPDLADDPRFADNSGRMEHRELLRGELNASFRRRTRAEWLELLNAAGIPCGPILSMDEVFNDPQVLALGLVQTLSHPDLGEIRLIGHPLKFGAGLEPVRRPPPALGQDSRAVLSEFGWSQEEIASLIEGGIVRTSG